MARRRNTTTPTPFVTDSDDEGDEVGFEEEDEGGVVTTTTVSSSSTRQSPFSTSTTSSTVVRRRRHVHRSSTKPNDTDPALQTRDELVAEVKQLRKQLQQEMSHTRPFIEEAGTPFDFLYQPHTVTILAITLAVIGYVAFYRPTGGTTFESDCKLGIVCVFGVFLVYCCVQLRDSLMIRPHPAVWRGMHGMAILYLLIIVYLLVQTSHENLLRTFHFFDPSVGVVRPPKSQPAYDCRLYTPDHPSGNIMANLSAALSGDVFLLAHFLGWVAKAVVFRDWTFCIVLMFAWEVTEFSLQTMLGNFYECWWDHWILDVLVCNCGGMAVGMAICGYFSMKTYDWTGSGSTTRDKIARALAQLGPYDWTEFTWDFFSGPRRFAAFVILLLGVTVVELNAFFFLRIFWVKPSHFFNNARLFTWAGLSITSIRELYQYLTDPRQRRIGFNIWLSLGILCTEAAIVYKFSDDDLLIQPIPAIVFQCWGTSLVGVVCWLFLKFDFFNWFNNKRTRARGWAMNLAFAVAVAPIIYLCYDRDVGYGRRFNGPPVVN